jgi:hypothetical protein
MRHTTCNQIGICCKHTHERPGNAARLTKLGRQSQFLLASLSRWFLASDRMLCTIVISNDRLHSLYDSIIGIPTRAINLFKMANVASTLRTPYVPSIKLTNTNKIDCETIMMNEEEPIAIISLIPRVAT